MENKLLQIQLKVFQQEQFKKPQKQLSILWAIKLLIKVTEASDTSPKNNSVTNEEEILINPNLGGLFRGLF